MRDLRDRGAVHGQRGSLRRLVGAVLGDVGTPEAHGQRRYSQNVTSVSVATRADIGPLSRTLARAFADDPVSAWFYRRDGSRARYLERFFAWQLGRSCPRSRCRRPPTARGAALWALPDRWRETPGEGLRLLRAVGPALLPHLPAALWASRASSSTTRASATCTSRCSAPTRAPGRGHRLGAARARAGAVRHARASRPTSSPRKERNVAFYGRFGFRVTDEIRLPRGGPPVWLMWRDPR